MEKLEGETMSVSADKTDAGTYRECDGAENGNAKGKGFERFRTVMNAFVLRSIVCALCFIVFVSGFFMQMQYTSLDDINSDIELNIVGIQGLNDLLEGDVLKVEQNYFNAIFAATVGTDPEKNLEGCQEFEEKITSINTKIFEDYRDELMELRAAIEAGEAGAENKLIDFLKKVLDEYCVRLSEINVIKYDRMIAEYSYSIAEGPDYQIEKVANDMLIRNILLIGETAAYLYLQVTSTVFLILFGLGFIGKKRVKAGKFFLMYLIGFFAMFAFCQLTATWINGVGMFCFVITVVLGGLYLIGDMLANRKVQASGVFALVAESLSAVFAFVACCLCYGSLVEFGGKVDKIGGVFGLHCFEEYAYEEGEGLKMTLMNLLMPGILYLAALTFSAFVFFMALRRMQTGKGVAVHAIVFTSLSAAFSVVFYLILFIGSQVGFLEVLYPLGGSVALIVMNFMAFIFVIASFISAKAQKNASVKRETESEKCLQTESDQIGEEL